MKGTDRKRRHGAPEPDWTPKTGESGGRQRRRRGRSLGVQQRQAKRETKTTKEPRGLAYSAHERGPIGPVRIRRGCAAHVVLGLGWAERERE